MSKNFQIVFSPAEPPIATVDGIVFSVKLGNADEVRLDINPMVSNYVEKPGEGIAQFLELGESDESGWCVLDTSSQREIRFCANGKAYTVKCLSTNQVEFDGQMFLAYNFFLEEHELTDLQIEGSIALTLRHENEAWQGDRNAYNFPPVTKIPDFRVHFTKTPDGQLHAIANGPCGRQFHLAHDISGLKGPTHVALTWKDNAANLYVNGQPAITEKFT